MSSSAGSVVSSPAWVASRIPEARPAPARAPAFEVGRGSGGGLVLLAVVWTALWAFFLLGVVAPGAALHGPPPEAARAASAPEGAGAVAAPEVALSGRGAPAPAPAR